MAATGWAQTQGLERVGPTSTANGFPLWYQDKSGIALEFCQPLNQGELDGGWCLLLPADTTVPEQFPAFFADEHFFFAADASATGPTGFNALLVIGLEAAFAVGPVINGDQIVFARIRIRFDAPATGKYTIQHPYGTDILDGVAGQRVFYTEDIGITCQGNFDCALRGRIGPFLLASNTPGGTELPAVAGPVTGKLYIADPARLGPVTGSPVAQNFFRVTGPSGEILAETSDFSLMGRLFQGTMAGRVTIDRASYSRATAGALTGKTDVFATASPTTPTRLPGAAPAPVVQPLLDFFPSACAIGLNGALGLPPGTSLSMVADGSRHYGQITDGTIPAAVCVRDSTARDAFGQVVPVFREAPVTDTVAITQASYVPGTAQLSVTAVSSDADNPALSALLIGALTNGTGSLETWAPPAKVFVTSVKGGRAEADVITGAGVPTPPNRPIAVNDIATVLEDSGANAIDVLDNDTAAGTVVTVAIVGAPRLGTAVVNAANMIEFTPNPNAFGGDLITYTVTVDGNASAPAFVSITITNVNDAPVAVDDLNYQGTVGAPTVINLFANDTDADGALDLRTVLVTQTSTIPGVVWSVAGGVLTVTGPEGTHTFTYQAQDAALALSNTASVSVILTSSENLTIVRAEFIANKRRWRVEGTTDILTAHNVFVNFADGVLLDGTSAAGSLVGTAQAVGGLWALDLTLAGGNDPRVPTSPVYLVRPTRVYASTTGGLSPAIVFQLR
jgi:hypothetical protein